MSTRKIVDDAKDFEPFDGPKYDSLYSKIHAWTIGNTNSVQEQNSQISEHLIEEGYNLAYKHILACLKYLEKRGADSNSDDTLKNAAQILEKLYWDESSGLIGRTDALETAALAYYLAGYYARAYVLMQGVDKSTNSANNMMTLMFLRKLPKIRDLALKTLSQAQFRDKFLADSISKGSIDQVKAVNFALEGTLHRIYLLFYEYARIGNDDLIKQAIDFCNIGILFAIDQQLSDWWWTFYCTAFLLREYHRNSLWTCLRPMIDDNPLNPVKRYIHAAFWRPVNPILELWRSQSHVVENINDGRSYCVKMPTGSGKTRIAELTILKFLLDTRDKPDKKCLYIAPYRALAVELEQSLRQSFARMDVSVSQLYGSYDLNPAESLIVEDSRVLIATPEKMDAFLRYNADIAKQIGLVIVDEGHIIDNDERGLRFELFVHRLVRRFERNGIRMLFISAVMPNLDQFSRWITGRDSTDGVLTSDWQATQLLLGFLQWNGQSGHVNQLYRNRKRLDGDHVITDYMSAFDPVFLREANCGRQKYPKKNATKSEIVALAAIEALKSGAVLIFTPMKSSVKSIAKELIEVIELQEKINEHLGESQAILPKRIRSKEDKNKFDRCLSYAKECTGEDSIIVRALSKGFVIHDGDIPHVLRVGLEELFRRGIIQVIVATTTLSQGVNLPVKTILIHSLYNRIGGHQRLLSSRDFWNLCGRAGRALCETEGYVYVLAMPEEAKNISDRIDWYVQQAQSEKIMSAVRQLLENVVRAWRQKFPHLGTVDIAMLCQKLTDDDEHWLSNGNDDFLTEELRAKFRVLDSALLALIEEQQLLEITDPEKDLNAQVMELFQYSFFYIQMNDDPSKVVSISETISLLVQRVEHIARICKTAQRRQCYYSMGLSLEGCNIIERSKDELVTYLQRTESYMDWSPKERAEYIVKLCEVFLMPLEDIQGWKASDKPSTCWPYVLEHWLLGKNALEIHTNLVPTDGCETTMKVSTLIDNLCEFRLPWGLNAIAMFWQNSEGISEDTDETPFTPPEIASYFASMLRFGVHDPVATVALALGLNSRKAALALAELYIGSVDAQSILFWLRMLDQDVVSTLIDDEVLQRLLIEFITSIQKYDDFSEAMQNVAPITIVVKILGYADDLLTENDTEVLTYSEDGMVHFYTQTGDFLGTTDDIEDAEAIRRIRSATASVVVRDVSQKYDEVFFHLLIGRTSY